jgi:hypothetical protein
MGVALPIAHRHVIVTGEAGDVRHCLLARNIAAWPPDDDRKLTLEI